MGPELPQLNALSSARVLINAYPRRPGCDFLLLEMRLSTGTCQAWSRDLSARFLGKSALFFVDCEAPETLPWLQQRTEKHAGKKKLCKCRDNGAAYEKHRDCEKRGKRPSRTARISHHHVYLQTDARQPPSFRGHFGANFPCTWANRRPERAVVSATAAPGSVILIVPRPRPSMRRFVRTQG